MPEAWVPWTKRDEELLQSSLKEQERQRRRLAARLRLCAREERRLQRMADAVGGVLPTVIKRKGFVI